MRGQSTAEESQRVTVNSNATYISVFSNLNGRPLVHQRLHSNTNSPCGEEKVIVPGKKPLSLQSNKLCGTGVFLTLFGG